MMVALVISATREPLRGATEFCHWDFKALKKRPQIVKRTGLGAVLLLVGHPIWGVGPGPLNSPIRFAIGRHSGRKLLSPTHASGVHLCVAARSCSISAAIYFSELHILGVALSRAAARSREGVIAAAKNLVDFVRKNRLL